MSKVSTVPTNKILKEGIVPTNNRIHIDFLSEPDSLLTFLDLQVK